MDESRILVVSTQQKLRKDKELMLQDKFNSDTWKELEDSCKSTETAIKTVETKSLNIVGTGQNGGVRNEKLRPHIFLSGHHCLLALPVSPCFSAPKFLLEITSHVPSFFLSSVQK